MKKFFSAILLMTMMVFSVGTFVSCNDLVEEVETIKGQTTDIENAIAGLETEIAALETALQNAKAEAADAAKKAADAAAAADAKAADAAAQAAAAQAEVDALEAALADAKAVLEGKADVEDVEAAVKDIEALKAALAGNVETVEALVKRVEILEAALENYKALLEELKVIDFEGLLANVDYCVESLVNLNGMVEANTADIEDLLERLAEAEKAIEAVSANLTGYSEIIDDLVNRIESLVYVPETTAGTMKATQYYLPDANKDGYRDFESDILVKATYEVTPAKYAEDIKHVYFNTVPVKAADAEIVEAEVVEAKNGRVTVYARIKASAANIHSYAALTGLDAYVDNADHRSVALALNVVNRKEDVMLPDSTVVNGTSHVSSAYTAVTEAAAYNIVSAIGLYNTADNNKPYAANAADKTIAYNDNNTYKLLSTYAPLVAMENQLMTLEQASELLRCDLDVEYDVAVSHKGADNKELDATNPKVVFPIVDVKDGFNTSLQNTKTSKEFFGYNSTVTLSDFVLNEDYDLTLGADATLTLSYATANITFETFDAGKWSYEYYENAADSKLHLITPASNTPQRYHYYDFNLNNKIAKERAVASNVDITTLTPVTGTNSGVTENSDGTMTIDVKAPYTGIDGKTYNKDGKVKVEVLSSKAVALHDAELEFHDTDVTYVASFKMRDADLVEYTVEFKLNLGAKPSDKTIYLNGGNPIVIDGYTTLDMSNSITPMADVLAVDGKFYEDIMEVKSDYSNVTTVKFYNFAPTAQTGAELQFGSTLYSWDDNNKKFVETATVKTDSADKYDATDDVSVEYVLFGVKYTFVGKVQLQKPNWTITREASLVNAENMAEVVGTVGFPNWVGGTPKTFTSEPFALNMIDLRKYIYVDEKTTKAIDNGELELVYALQKTEKDNDGNAILPANITPVSTTVNSRSDDQTTQVVEKSKLKVEVKWDNKDITSIQYVISLQSVNATAEGDKTPVVFATVPVTLWVDDYVEMKVKATAPSKKFETGQNAVNKLNVVKAIEVVGTDKDLYPSLNTWGYLYNPAATGKTDFFYPCTYSKTVSNMTSITPADDDPDFRVYGQAINILGKDKSEAKLASGATYTGNWSVDPTTGVVELFDHDSPLIEDVIITVPVELTHWYGAKETVKAQVIFKK